MTSPDDGRNLFDFLPDRPAASETVQRPEGAPADGALLDAVVAAIATVHDPEIPVNIVDLGLIYDLVATTEGVVYVEMTLTSPACPVAGSMPGEVERAARGVAGVTDVRVKLVWSPPWSQDRMSDAARLELGLL